MHIAFSGVVYPCLLLAYLGQAAYLLNHPENVGNPQINSRQAIPSRSFSLILSRTKVTSWLMALFPPYKFKLQVRLSRSWAIKLSHAGSFFFPCVRLWIQGSFDIGGKIIVMCSFNLWSWNLKIPNVVNWVAVIMCQCFSCVEVCLNLRESHSNPLYHRPKRAFGLKGVAITTGINHSVAAKKRFLNKTIACSTCVTSWRVRHVHEVTQVVKQVGSFHYMICLPWLVEVLLIVAICALSR